MSGKPVTFSEHVDFKYTKDGIPYGYRPKKITIMTTLGVKEFNRDDNSTEENDISIEWLYFTFGIIMGSGISFLWN